jgi:predicted MFS family arabinose efflux permease
VSVYLRILRHPHMAALLGATLIARLPVGINGLAIVLFLHAETGSFAVAGVVAGGLALGVGAGAPLMGRVVDRQGVRVLAPLACCNAAGLVGLVAAGSTGAPTVVLVALAVATGALFPPTPSTMRARFPALLRERPELVPSAYALDSVLLEVMFVCAPLLVAVIVALVEPAAALVVSAAAVLVGVAVFLWALPSELRTRGRSEHDSGMLGALREPGIRTLAATMLPIGFAIGALEVALPAFSDERSSAELAGVLLAIWSLGSAAGGLVYGARTRRSSLAQIHLRLTLLLPLALVPLLLAPSMSIMALLLLPAGAFIAPIIASRNELASSVAAPGTETEALTWPLTALVAGIAGGAALAGGLIDASGSGAAIAAAVAGATAGAIVATSRRSTLRAAVAAS